MQCRKLVCVLLLLASCDAVRMLDWRKWYESQSHIPTDVQGESAKSFLHLGILHAKPLGMTAEQFMASLHKAEYHIERDWHIWNRDDRIVWQAVQGKLYQQKFSVKYAQQFKEPKHGRKSVCLIVVAGMHSHKYFAFCTLLHTLVKHVKYTQNALKNSARYVQGGTIYINLFNVGCNPPQDHLCSEFCCMDEYKHTKFCHSGLRCY